MITHYDVIFLMQRGAVVALGIETQEQSEKHTRTQIEAIVARETARLRVALEDALDEMEAVSKLIWGDELFFETLAAGRRLLEERCADCAESIDGKPGNGACQQCLEEI